MRPQKVEDTDLLNGLMAVLRAKGYDGASLNELASASGLQKASLYHRYPGGKKAIALAVLNYVDEWVEQHVLELLSNTQISAEERLEKAIENINQLYNNGATACLLRAMSTDNSLQLFGKEIRSSMQKWLDGFSTLGQDLGLKKQDADQKAMEALIAVQGSLVVAKTFGSTGPFQDALRRIKLMYMSG